jgi:hypothetical protein
MGRDLEQFLAWRNVKGADGRARLAWADRFQSDAGVDRMTLAEALGHRSRRCPSSAMPLSLQ